MIDYIQFTISSFSKDSKSHTKQLTFLFIFLMLLLVFRDNPELLVVTYVVIYPISYIVVSYIRYAQFKRNEEQISNNQVDRVEINDG